MRSLLAALSATLALAAPAPLHAGEEELAQEAVFQRQHLDNIEAPTTLRYRFERSGSWLGEKDDRADLVITAIGPDGRKRVEFRLFSGRDARNFAPEQGFRNNPMIVAFLQRDVEQMSRIGGGSPHYFRNRIREAFTRSEAVRAERVALTFEGRELAGIKVTLEPFVGDTNLVRFPQLQHKRYEFVLAPEIPGGVYSLRALVPNGAAEPLLDEVFVYRGTS